MRRHTIDVIFSLSLFTVFVVCCFLLLLFQINGYRDLQEDDMQLYTAISYLQTEIRQNDEQDNIQVDQFDGISCLIIKQKEGIAYYYVQQGYLKELYQDVTLPVDLTLGEKRFKADDMQLNYQKDHIDITLQHEQQNVQLSIHLRSKGLQL